MYKQLESASIRNLPIANQIADEVLCLPIYPDLEQKHVENICNIIFEFKK